MCDHIKPVFGCQSCIDSIKFYRNKSELEYYNIRDEYNKLVDELERYVIIDDKSNEDCLVSNIYDKLGDLFELIGSLLETMKNEAKTI